MALRDILAQFGVKVDDSQLKKADKSIFSTIGGLRQLGAVIAGAAVVQGVRGFIDNIRNMGDELDKSSRQLGISAKDLQEYRHAANLSGVGSEKFTQSLRLLQKNLDMAADGGKTQADLFKRLGIEVRGADDQVRSVTDVLPQLAEGLNSNRNATERTGLAFQLLGRSGALLLPMFEQGAEGLAAMRKEAEELGGGLEQDAISKAAELTDTLARWDFAMLSIKSRIATAILPIIDRAAVRITKWTVAIQKAIKGTTILETGLKVLGAAGALAAAKILKAFAPLFLKFAIWAAIIALIVVAVDDLIVTFEGGDSATRRFIDGLFGEGTTEKIVDNIKLITEDVTKLVDLLDRERPRVNKFLTELAANGFKWTPPGMVVSGIDEMIERLGLFGGKSDTVFSKVKSGFGSVIDFMTQGWVENLDFQLSLLTGHESRIGQRWRRIGDRITAVWDDLLNKWNALWAKASYPIAALQTAVELAFDIIRASAEATAKAVYLAFKPQLDLASAAFRLLKAAASDAWNNIKSGAKSAAGFVGDVFASAIDGVASIFTGLWETIAGGFQSVFDKIKGLVDHPVLGNFVKKILASGPAVEVGERFERNRQAAQQAGTVRTQNVNAPSNNVTNVNVTVPPGTTGAIAHETARRTSRAVGQSTAAQRSAVAFEAP
jgi:hypothetical protein